MYNDKIAQSLKLNDYIGNRPEQFTIEEIFNFDKYLNKEILDEFIDLFLLKYRYREIAFETMPEFIAQLEYKVRTLSSKYGKLYDSQNFINNPFINTILETDLWSRNKQLDKSINTTERKSQDDNYQSTAGVDVSRNGEQSLTSRDNLSKSDSNKKRKTAQDSGNKNENRFADTPQTPVSVTNSNGETTNINPINTFLTTMETNKASARSVGSENEDEYNKNASQSSGSVAKVGNSYSDTIRESQVINNGKENQSTNYTGGYNNTKKLLQQNYGLQGETVSKVLNEYRTTLINVMDDFINECYDLFLLIY